MAQTQGLECTVNSMRQVECQNDHAEDVQRDIPQMRKRLDHDDIQVFYFPTSIVLDHQDVPIMHFPPETSQMDN